MTTRRLYERDLPGVLDDLAAGAYPDYLDHVLAVTATRRQRPRWMALERWLPMDLALPRATTRRVPFRTLAVLAILLLLIVLAVATVGQRRPLPPPFGRAANGDIPYSASGDIFLGDPVTRTSRVLVSGPDWDWEPMFSRHGNLIAFMRGDFEGDPQSTLQIMERDGSRIRPLSGPMALKAWAWTADDRLVVTTENHPGLQVLDPQHPDTPISLAPDYAVDSPTVRPGTDEILFYSKGLDGNIALYVMHADGSGLHPITDPRPTEGDRWDLLYPKYSPDGSRIAVPHWAAGHLSVWILDPDGKVLQDIVGPPEFWYWGDPVWSNDGTRISINRIRDTSDGSDPVKPIGIVDLATGKVLETGPTLGTDGGLVEWAPDDSLLYLVKLDSAAGGPELLDPLGGAARSLPWKTPTEPNIQRLAP
jgi:hypothetical protein